MTVCFQYSRPASGQTNSEIYGLDVAVSNLLSAWFRHGTADPFVCRPTDIPSFDHFKDLAEKAGIPSERCIGIDPRTPRHNLEKIGCLVRADPLTADQVWRRQQLQGRGYATCGLVHTMSGERIARAVNELCIAPTDASDALICPSNAIRDAVRSLWDIYADYLNHRFGGTFRCPVQTPVIPLGINSEKFTGLSTPSKRAAQRQSLDAGEDEVVILFVGRLSFATKAHPLPLFRAAEDAARATGKRIRLVMFGYFKPQDMEPHFRSLAADICRTAQVDFIMNDDPRFPDGLWAGADIFASFSDNIQESFGLTPLEAMASGLPVVITDWDGYRDGARYGIDGYLVPTVAPPPSAGQAVAEAYYNEENYGVSLVGAAQSTAVDITQATAAFTALAADAEKRRTFGDNGRRRAQDTYDWKHIIPAYESLWHDLSLRRQSMSLVPAIPQHWPAAHPAYPNPLHMFRSFPTEVLAPDIVIQIILDPANMAALFKHEMNFFYPALLLPQPSMLDLIDGIRRAGTAYVRDILAPFPSTEHDRILRCIGWMLKHGAARIYR